MRTLAGLVLVISATSAAAPARAQTYDPNYPVCLQIYQGFVDYYFECAYTSLAQCQMSASGRAASCVVNPYYAGGKGRRDRRQRRAALSGQIDRDLAIQHGRRDAERPILLVEPGAGGLRQGR